MASFKDYAPVSQLMCWTVLYSNWSTQTVTFTDWAFRVDNFHTPDKSGDQFEAESQLNRHNFSSRIGN